MTLGESSATSCGPSGYSSTMFPGIGTLINVVAIIGGAGLGIFVGHRLGSKTRTLLTDVLGLATILGAASALIPLWSARYVESLPTGWPLLVVLGSLIFGGLIGSALGLEDRLDHLGENLRRKFKASKESPFVEGFVTASLLFAIGPLAILGSIRGYQVDAMTIVGGVLLIGIGLRLLNIKQVAVGNLLPALAIAPLLVMLVHSFI